MVHATGAAEVVGVSYRLDSVLRNLLENAASSSGPGGTVTLTVDALPGRVEIAVTDTGPGLAEQDLRSRASSRRAAASGERLGLALARAVVEAHGGTISVSSEPGRGAAFRVLVPGAPAP